LYGIIKKTKKIGEIMFSRPGTYPACGMFNTIHFISMTICFITIITCVVLTRKITTEKMNKVIKITAIIVSVLEVVKMAFNIYYEGFNYLNNIIPLHFCSLFIYSLWMAGFGKGTIKNIGESFLAGGCIIAGAFFLIMPSSSLLIFPIFHYQCLYSLLFHSLMLYFGLMYFIKGFFKLNFKNYIYYFIFVSIFCVLAFSINEITGLIENINSTNLMFIREPWGLPLDFLVKIYNIHPYLYSFCIYIAYALLIYLPTMGLKTLISNRKDMKNYD